jgi:hypothetical protein
MSAEQGKVLLAVDPGTGKCGVAVVGADGEVVARTVVSTGELWRSLRQLLEDHPIAVAVVGDRTGSEAVWREAHNACQARGVPVHKIAEHGSTREGLLRYWRENPRRGWRRLFPPGWLQPPEPFDDYVAVVLAERWLSRAAEEQTA